MSLFRLIQTIQLGAVTVKKILSLYPHKTSNFRALIIMHTDYKIIACRLLAITIPSFIFVMLNGCTNPSADKSSHSISDYRLESNGFHELKQLSDGCENDSGEACFELAQKMQTVETKLPLMAKSCSLNVENACLILGISYDVSLAAMAAKVKKDKVLHELEEDLETAFNYYEKSCENNNHVGCLQVGRAFFAGKGVSEDDSKGILYYKKSCDLGGGFACQRLGSNYTTGRTVTKNLAMAAQYYKKGCENADYESCYSMGYNFENGIGVSKDLVRAIEYHESNCRNLYGKSCNNLAHLYQDAQGTSQDLSKAAKYFEEACATKIASACDNTGAAYYLGNGVAKDISIALKFTKKACELNESNCDNYEFIKDQQSK